MFPRCHLTCQTCHRSWFSLDNRSISQQNVCPWCSGVNIDVHSVVCLDEKELRLEHRDLHAHAMEMMKDLIGKGFVDADIKSRWYEVVTLPSGDI